MADKDQSYDPPAYDTMPLHGDEESPPTYHEALNYETIGFGGPLSSGDGQMKPCSVCEELTDKLYWRKAWKCNIKHRNMCRACASNNNHCPACGPRQVLLPIGRNLPPTLEK
jgi:hypothetical protein